MATVPSLKPSGADLGNARVGNDHLKPADRGAEGRLHGNKGEKQKRKNEKEKTGTQANERTTPSDIAPQTGDNKRTNTQLDPTPPQKPTTTKQTTHTDATERPDIEDTNATSQCDGRVETPSAKQPTQQPRAEDATNPTTGRKVRSQGAQEEPTNGSISQTPMTVTSVCGEGARATGDDTNAPHGTTQQTTNTNTDANSQPKGEAATPTATATTQPEEDDATTPHDGGKAETHRAQENPTRGSLSQKPKGETSVCTVAGRMGSTKPAGSASSEQAQTADTEEARLEKTKRVLRELGLALGRGDARSRARVEMAWRHYIDQHTATTQGKNQRRKHAAHLEDFCRNLVEDSRPDDEEEEDDATSANYGSEADADNDAHDDAHHDDHPDTTADNGDTADLEEEWAE
jgi:hypothetical protein